MKRTPLNATLGDTGDIVHAVIQRDHGETYFRTLCVRVLTDHRPYHWSEAPVNCLECLTEESRR